jgi:hypothetical protein
MMLISNRNRSVLSTAFGTLIRAENLDDGPLRVPRLSIGLLRDHEYQGLELARRFPEFAPIEKQKKRRKFDPVLNRHYVEDVIQWVVKVVGHSSHHHYTSLTMTQGQAPLQRVHESDYHPTEYCFWPQDIRWMQTEPVYVSSTCTDSYWAVNHPRNKG